MREESATPFGVGPELGVTEGDVLPDGERAGA
jgi:hypothetical protein